MSKIKIKIQGQRGSGKSTIADIIENALKCNGFPNIVVDDGNNRSYSHRNKYITERLGSKTIVQISCIQDNKLSSDDN